jgi:large subunit ribosomal protein L19e
MVIMARLQKRLAARIFKVGQSRVWLDPSKMKDIEKAITYADVRRLILKGWIKKLPEKVKLRDKEKKRRRGPGSKKGKKHAIIPKKRKWINTVRPLRRYLKELKASGKIDNPTFKKLYKLVKGGSFRSRAHLRIYMEQRGLFKESKEKTKE